MRRLEQLLLPLCLLPFVTCAFAQEPYPTGPYSTEREYLTERWNNTTHFNSKTAVGLIRAVELDISDQVDGGCWTNVGAVRARARSELERSGIPVFSEPMAIYNILSPRVSITILGYKASGGLCVGHLSMDVDFLGSAEIGSLGHTNGIFSINSKSTVWSRSTIFSGPSLNPKAMEIVQEFVDTFGADVSAAKREQSVSDFSRVWPKAQPQTAAESEASLKRLFEEMNNDR